LLQAHVRCRMLLRVGVRASAGFEGICCLVVIMGSLVLLNSSVPLFLWLSSAGPLCTVASKLAAVSFIHMRRLGVHRVCMD
jgi:hypothetical protein